MPHAIRVAQPGGPDVLKLEPISLAAPGPGEVLMRVEAVGLNFIDVYHRTGLYPLPLPTGIGLEAAGVIEAVGPDVTSLAVGDAVATGWGPIGTYASHRVVPAASLVRLPEGIDPRTAAAAILKGCTVEYLVQRVFPVKPGQTVLWHAAAGGVGLIAGQWLKSTGAIAIGTAGGPEKCALAAAHGYTHVIDYLKEDVVARVKEITGGKGCAAVYDSVGKDSWEISLKACAPRGTIASFGNASGPVEGVNLGVLSAHGGLFVTRPSIFHYYGDPAEKAAGCAALFDRLADGRIKPRIDQTYALADAAQAHRDLEARRTTGSSLLIP
jgi:NADPH:quinone reductase